jgi:hypothetical protein
VICPLSKVSVASVVVPSLKVTVPVTVFGSVAVKVTIWPMLDGLGVEVSVTFGVALLTI